jgi:hypothetical protein
LAEPLRRTLSLVEYYGQIEADEATLFELKLALIRAIEWGYFGVIKTSKVTPVSNHATCPGLLRYYLGKCRKQSFAGTVMTCPSQTRHIIVTVATEAAKKGMGLK